MNGLGFVHAAGSPGEAVRLRRQLALLKSEMVSAAASQEAEAERMEQVPHLKSDPKQTPKSTEPHPPFHRSNYWDPLSDCQSD